MHNITLQNTYVNSKITLDVITSLRTPQVHPHTPCTPNLYKNLTESRFIVRFFAIAGTSSLLKVTYGQTRTL